MPAMVIASTWMNMGGAVLIYLAALQNIPGELYEAAELDGAGILRRIWHVTIPQTRLILRCWRCCRSSPPCSCSSSR
jgi:multiple sugar transport system permease protein